MTSLDIVVAGINPQPWTVGILGVGYSGKRAYPVMTKSGQLETYQNALMDEVARKLPGGFTPYDETLAVHFLFWRQIESWTTERGTKSRSKVADATNLQKSTEDAVQKVLYKNDQANIRVQSDIIEQNETTTPLIVIRLRPYSRNENELKFIRTAWEEKL